MSDFQSNERLRSLMEQMFKLRKDMRDALAESATRDVEDYPFTTTDGPVRLSDLFGGKTDLFLIHNMGKGCTYCTLWADGFNGVYPHLADRARFVVSSPDSPAVQKAFAESRGWRFPMVSQEGTTFAADLGLGGEDENSVYPGVSVFQLKDGKIRRVSATPFGPGDEFCPVWQFLDLLPEGANGWEPKMTYA
ncbi:MAG: DUF899 family protein [Alphaproteobacteria bacterium]